MNITEFFERSRTLTDRLGLTIHKDKEDDLLVIFASLMNMAATTSVLIGMTKDQFLEGAGIAFNDADDRVNTAETVQ